MRKIFAFCLIALFTLTSLQTFAQSQRMLMVEEGTQASCGPCATQNPGFDALLDVNADNVVVLKYHTSWPGFDPMHNDNMSEVNARVSYYDDFGGVPSVFVNGVKISIGLLSQADINVALSQTSPLDLNLAVTVDGDMLTMTGSVEATEAVSGDLKLRIAIIEKNIDFNSSPGSNGEKEFHHVLKKFIGGAEGTDLANSWAMGDTYTIDESFDLSTLNIYKPSQVMVVAFVQDDATKAIHQAAKAADPLYANSASVAQIQEIRPACLGLQDLNPVVKISNEGGETLTSLDITYSVNGGAEQVYNWTGTITSLERKYVSLAPYSFESIFENTLIVSTSNPNGVTDDNQDSSKDYIFEIGNEIQTDKVSIKIYPDAHPCEIYWEFTDVATGTVLASGGNDTAVPGGQTITYEANYSCPDGVGYPNNSTHTEEIELPATGCYEFHIIDDWGDGITGSAYVIRGENNLTLVSGSDFLGAEARHRINAITSSVNVEDVVNEQSFNAFPNPAQNKLNLQFNLLKSSEIYVVVYDVLGQTVKSIPATTYGTGINNLQINIDDLTNGIYIVALKTEEDDLSKRVTISK